MAINWLVTLPLFAMLASACSNCIPGPSSYVRGEMTTALDNEGAFVTRSATSRTSKTITLRNESDTGRVTAGEPFTLIVPDVLDLGKKAVKVNQVSSSDEDLINKKNFEITLVDACSPVVRLERPCQIVNWYNPYRLPQIEVASGTLDQVIVTPIISEGNYVIGYEIRHGDQINSGCTSKVFDSWKDVFKSTVEVDRLTKKRKAQSMKIVSVPKTSKQQPRTPEDLLLSITREPKEQR